MTESRRLHPRVLRLSAAAALLSAALAGCNESEPPATSPSASTPSPTATSTWESEFSAEELAIYREAVARANAYERTAQAFFAAGEATREAKEFFQDHLMTWQTRWADLESYAEQGIKIARAPKVLSSQATSVDLLAKGAADVNIVRCVDASDLGGTIKGEPLPESTTEPVTQNVDVHKLPDGSWRIGEFETTEQPCDG